MKVVKLSTAVGGHVTAPGGGEAAAARQYAALHLVGGAAAVQ